MYTLYTFFLIELFVYLLVCLFIALLYYFYLGDTGFSEFANRRRRSTKYEPKYRLFENDAFL